MAARPARSGPARPAGPACSCSPRAAFAAAGSQWPAELSPPLPRPPSALHHWPKRAALQGATGLNVQQGPKLLQVRKDRQVTLTCQVLQLQAWEQLHVKWTKAGVAFCPPCVTNSNLSLEIRGPQGWLFWWPPGILTLQLDCVSLNNSGNYLCWTTTETAELVEAKGSGTQLLLETGMRTSQEKRQGLGPQPQPWPSHPISTGRISPGPGSSRYLRSGGFLEPERGVRTPGGREEGPSSTYIKMTGSGVLSLPGARPHAFPFLLSFPHRRASPKHRGPHKTCNQGSDGQQQLILG
ncbi:transmembrane and immunoglobulin domain-containing protein 2 [Phyllostomus discolor]|uniref:transmembrane and immunoglobulin domain-containing protein 2 n=1 Tax=Phyllostomus discolor TaxID=89673 RepID=UPI00165834A5|nr:transmembrane and immunoglobulin domain-containing protein 2 [Phyllostomus discolor]